MRPSQNSSFFSTGSMKMNRQDPLPNTIQTHAYLFSFQRVIAPMAITFVWILAFAAKLLRWRADSFLGAINSSVRPPDFVWISGIVCQGVFTIAILSSLRKDFRIWPMILIAIFVGFWICDLMSVFGVIMMSGDISHSARTF
jgi:hypothetical protein